ncbi:MAG: DoxX family protein [Ilumatobacteraceae bacterium]|nr:DoxX family protein [Ilumatobacteraceae bacterium]
MEPLDLGLLVLRVVFGVFLALHGANKVRGGLDGVAGWFGSIGMRAPRLQARAAAGAEIGAGLLFAVGLLTPLAAAGIVGTMTVATWAAHRMNGFFIFNEGQGWEYTVSIAAAAFAVGTIGPGTISLDHALDLTVEGWTGAWIAGGLGLAAGIAQLALFYRPGRPS